MFRRTYEIRAIYRGEDGEDSTTSGPLHMSKRKAMALFRSDIPGLTKGETLELSDYDTEEVIARAEGSDNA